MKWLQTMANMEILFKGYLIDDTALDVSRNIYMGRTSIFFVKNRICSLSICVLSSYQMQCSACITNMCFNHLSADTAYKILVRVLYIGKGGRSQIHTKITLTECFSPCISIRPEIKDVLYVTALYSKINFY